MKLRLYVLGLLLAALTGNSSSAELIKIGALTEGWGPTPAMVGLRDGLNALGYKEGEQYVIGVRFTQGDVKGLPDAVRDLLSSGSTIIFATGRTRRRRPRLRRRRYLSYSRRRCPIRFNPDWCAAMRVLAAT
jgi:ABC-type uncharacterized transport system substrate-binding protein